MRLLTIALPAVFLPLLLVGCGGKGQHSGAGGQTGTGALVVPFWHTRRGSQEKALEALCVEFEKSNPGIDLVPEFQGSYGDLSKKIRAASLAGALPALTVAYDTQVTEYMQGGSVIPLDPLVSDPTSGFSEAELQDFPKIYLEGNRYPQFSDQLLSFPFTKSNLVLYYNKSLLAKSGFTVPPRTWSELERQAAVITTATRKPALSFASDASTLDGMIFSYGGDVLSPGGKSTLFDQPATVRVFELLQRMAKAKTLAEASGDDAPAMFGSQLSAFTITSSAGRAAMEERVGSTFDWDLAIIPHGEGASPVTVAYGPSVCIFKTTPEKQAAAWKFVRYFVSPEVTARWARETGYLPVRKSSVKLPEMVEFYRKNPRAQHVYEVLQHARAEPNVLGWGEVRTELEKAASRVIGTGTSPSAAAVELKQTADKILAQSN
jgi:ABC-type glycerol-3-phosphate transport system substrate-binding protein